MMMHKYSFLSLIFVLAIISCSNPKKKEEEDKKEEKQKMEEKAEEVTLEKIESFAEFPDSKLNMVQPEKTEISAGNNTFQFKVDSKV
jgi:protein subunit release factor B